MRWEQRVREFLSAQEQTLLGFDYGLVFYKTKEGQVFGSGETSLIENMKKWEKERSQYGL